MKSELDIDRISEAITEGTKKSEHTGEDFWVQAELMLQRALIGYLYFDSKDPETGVSYMCQTWVRCGSIKKYVSRGSRCTKSCRADV